MYVFVYICIYTHISTYTYIYIDFIIHIEYIYESIFMYIHSHDTHQKNNILSLVTVLEKKKNVFSKCKIDI